MDPFIIPPRTDVGPITKIEQTENGYKVTTGYTEQAINEMVRRANEALDEELMKRLAEQHSYIKPIYCRDCEFVYIEDGAIKRHWCDRKEHGKAHSFLCGPKGYCAWGKRREDKGSEE